MTENELKKIFTKRIKCRLRALHIDQRELARRAGLTDAAVSRYMKGYRKPTYDIVIRLAQALECSAGDLIDIEEDFEYDM